MKNYKHHLFFIVGALVILIAAIYYVWPAQILEYEMDVKVQGPAKIGFNIDTDAIHFGIVPPGSSANREALIENAMDSRLVKIKPKGDIATWVSISPNNFILEGRSNKTVEFKVSIPKGTEPGNYTGNAVILFYRR